MDSVLKSQHLSSGSGGVPNFPNTPTCVMRWTRQTHVKKYKSTSENALGNLVGPQKLWDSYRYKLGVALPGRVTAGTITCLVGIPLNLYLPLLLGGTHGINTQTTPHTSIPSTQSKTRHFTCMYANSVTFFEPTAEDNSKASTKNNNCASAPKNADLKVHNTLRHCLAMAGASKTI